MSQHPKLRTCSSDTILRAIEELTEGNVSYTSDNGKTYEFNKAEKLNNLLLEALLTTGQLTKGGEYDFDFDHQFIETEKYDAKTTYKHFKGYGPGIAVINNMIVGVENRDGNTNVRFHQQDTLERMFLGLEDKGLKINRARMDCGSCSEEIVKMVEKHCKHFYIRANRCPSLYDDIFALRGWKKEVINDLEFELNSILVEKWKGKAYRLVIQRQKRIDERIFDEMNNGFGWSHLPKSFMSQNAAFLLLTALIYNFYKYIFSKLKVSDFGLKPTSRIKTFVFKFVSVAAKWIKAARQNVLNIYTSNQAYAKLDFG